MTELRSITHDSGFFSTPARPASDPALTSASGHGLRSICTALVALALGIALVSWLKAGGNETLPAVGSPLARPISAGR